VRFGSSSPASLLRRAAGEQVLLIYDVADGQHRRGPLTATAAGRQPARLNLLVRKQSTDLISNDDAPGHAIRALPGSIFTAFA